MLSYQHGFHAGNRADVLKHAVLDVILREIVQSKRPVLYAETHAARGVYDLTGEQANKTREAQSGVLSMMDRKAAKPLKPWMGLVREHGAKSYPGSPALAAARLRERDRMVLFEKHPTEFKHLTENIGDDPRVQLKKADGYSGALRLQPRAKEQMVCFVDPSYETEADMEALADWAPRALKRWPKAIVILWLPLFRDEREADFGAWLGSLEDGAIAGARWPVELDDESALEGSAIVAYRAPDATRSKMTAIAATLQSLWAEQGVIL